MLVGPPLTSERRTVTLENPMAGPCHFPPSTSLSSIVNDTPRPSTSMREVLLREMTTPVVRITSGQLTVFASMMVLGCVISQGPS